jgi:hypothetical protein
MGEYFDQIPEVIQPHIEQIAKTSGLPEGDESVEKISQGWLEKKDSFEQQIEKQSMEELESFAKDEERGALAMTYSGSLITIGPLQDDKRRVEYASIGLRQDVPDNAVDDSSSLAEDLSIDSEAVFEQGPIQKSSPIFKIAVYTEELDPDLEEEKLLEATQILTEEFVEVNKTIIVE